MLASCQLPVSISSMSASSAYRAMGPCQSAFWTRGPVLGSASSLSRQSKNKLRTRQRDRYAITHMSSRFSGSAVSSKASILAAVLQ